ncbi:unnamed protein product, partial [Ixodes pacificus]
KCLAGKTPLNWSQLEPPFGEEMISMSDDDTVSPSSSPDGLLDFRESSVSSAEIRTNDADELVSTDCRLPATDCRSTSSFGGPPVTGVFEPESHSSASSPALTSSPDSS